MIIDPEQWMKIGAFIGALALPLFLNAANERSKNPEKIASKLTWLSVLYGAVIGFLVALVLVGVCGALGVKMR